MEYVFSKGYKKATRDLTFKEAFDGKDEVHGITDFVYNHMDLIEDFLGQKINNVCTQKMNNPYINSFIDIYGELDDQTRVIIETQLNCCDTDHIQKSFYKYICPEVYSGNKVIYIHIAEDYDDTGEAMMLLKTFSNLPNVKTYALQYSFFTNGDGEMNFDTIVRYESGIEDEENKAERKVNMDLVNLYNDIQKKIYNTINPNTPFHLLSKTDPKYQSFKIKQFSSSYMQIETCVSKENNIQLKLRVYNPKDKDYHLQLDQSKFLSVSENNQTFVFKKYNFDLNNFTETDAQIVANDYKELVKLLDDQFN